MNIIDYIFNQSRYDGKGMRMTSFIYLITVVAAVAKPARSASCKGVNQRVHCIESFDIIVRTKKSFIFRHSVQLLHIIASYLFKP